MQSPDRIESLFAPWRTERPDLDIDTMVSVGRVLAVAQEIRAAIEANARRHGVSMADGDVLFALRRAGEPYVASPSRLAATLLMPTGTLTGRLDRLERAGAVERMADPSDRRAMNVGLTAAGLAATDEAVTAHVELEARFLAPLSARERTQLDRLLRKLLEQDGH